MYTQYVFVVHAHFVEKSSIHVYVCMYIYMFIISYNTHICA